MRSFYPLLQVAFFILFIVVIGRPITGCAKNPGPDRKTDSTDTVLHAVHHDSAIFYVFMHITEDKTSGVYNDSYDDITQFVIYVVDGAVRLDSIQNEAPRVFPSSGSGGIYTSAVFIPDSIGLINVASGSGFVEPDDTTVTIILNQSGTVTPKWRLLDNSGHTTTFGGDAVPGWPPGFIFSLKQDDQTPIQLFQPNISQYYVRITKE